MKALKPIAPPSAMASKWTSESGVSPPQSAKSKCDFSPAMSRFFSSDAASTTGGVEFSGMSKKVVPPAAASARLPVSKPSQSVRPGSLKCTWASIHPGTIRPSGTSTTCFAGPANEGPFAATSPSITPRLRSGVCTKRSKSLMPAAILGIQQAPGCPPRCRLEKHIHPDGEKAHPDSGRKSSRSAPPSKSRPRHARRRWRAAAANR